MKPSHELPKTHHEYVPPTPAADPLAKTGYVEKEYEHQEYPKWVDDKLVNEAPAEKPATPKKGTSTKNTAPAEKASE